MAKSEIVTSSLNLDNSLPRKRILIMNNEPDITDLILLTLEQKFYKCEVATDGLTGLAMLREGQFDLAIIRRSLPKMQGIDVCRIIREEGMTIPIIFCSSFGMRKEIDKIVSQKLIQDYVVLPFEPEKFRAKIAILR